VNKRHLGRKEQDWNPLEKNKDKVGRLLLTVGPDSIYFSQSNSRYVVEPKMQ